MESETLSSIVEAGRLYRASPGEFYFFQGDPATTLFILIEGRVQVLQFTPEGRQVVMRMVLPGDMFGGVALLGDVAYPASAESKEESTALGWDGATLLTLIERFPRIAINALHILGNRLQEIQARFQELATIRVEQRIARALLRLTRQAGQKAGAGVLIDFPISREELAAMTGTTLFTVSRTLSQWEKEGIIESGRQRICIRQPHRLVTIAEDLPKP